MNSSDDWDDDWKPAFPPEKSRSELLRRRTQIPPRKPGQLSYAEFLEWAAANGKSPRPIGRFEINPPLNPFDRSTKFTQTKGTRTLEDALDNLKAQITKARNNSPRTS
jgi:hypothetical protein